MSETKIVTFRCMIRPDGHYEIVTEGSPLGWISECLQEGGVIHTIEVELPLPPAKPNFIGRVKEGLGL